MTGPAGVLQPRRMSFDETIMSRIESGLARNDALGDTATFTDDAKGIHIIVEPGVAGERSAADTVATDLTSYLDSDSFDVNNGEHSAHDAIVYANEQIRPGDIGFMTSFMRFYHERRQKKLQAAVGVIGNASIVRYRKNFVTGRYTADTIADAFTTTHKYLNGQPDAPDAAKTTNIQVKDGDRYVIMSSTVMGDVATLAERHENAANQTDPEAAANILVAGSRSDKDKVAIVIDVSKRRRAASPAVGNVAAAGAGAVPGMVGSSSATVPPQGNVRTRKHNLYDRAGAGLTLGLASLAAKRGDYYNKHANHKRYQDRDVWTDEKIRQDLERRRARRGGLFVGAVALAAVTGLMLKYYGTDIMPTKFDRDAIDLWPTHGKTPFHATSAHDKVDGFSGWLFDDDPKRPVSSHTRVNTPPDTGGRPRVDNPPITPLPHEAPPSTVWHPESVTVGSDSVNTNSLEGIIHQMGHQQVGEVHFTGPGATRVLHAVRERFGDDIFVLDNHSGPSTYLEQGDLRISAPGLGHWRTQEIERFIHEMIEREKVA